MLRNHKKIKMKNKIEKRVLAADGGEMTIKVSPSAEKRMNKSSAVTLECRASAPSIVEKDGVDQIRGYAAVFNKDSEDLGGFVEMIAKGAFDNVLEDDVRAYINHDENRLLGRVSSETLRIGVDETGLFYEIDLPNTTYANDLKELMKRGDVKESSFAFLIEDDVWEMRGDTAYRIVTKVSRLFDVSPVAQPAYPDATSELKRDLETKPKEDVKAAPEAKATDLETKPKEDVKAATEAKATDSDGAKTDDGGDSDLYLYKLKTLNF